MKDKKCLIADFSRAGKNYVSGRIVNLPVGNTEVAARMIQELTCGDLFRIQAAKAYPDDYTETTEVARRELQGNARPELASLLNDIGQHDVVLLGYPNWWNTFPMPVFTFLEKHDLTGKMVVPFCTHEGSGLGRSERDIKRLCPGATLVEGLAIHGTHVTAARPAIEKWLTRIGLAGTLNAQRAQVPQ